jgi:DNA-binding NarL/FixJ family response regulator
MTSSDAGVLGVVLAGDSHLMNDGMQCLLDRRPDIKVVRRVDDVQLLQTIVSDLRPDALLVCLRTRAPAAMAVIREARQVRENHPDLGIVVVSDRGNGFALELLRGGSARTAYLLDEQLPGIEEVATALREVLSGQTVLDPTVVDALIRRRDAISVDHLTIREVDVLEQIAYGRSNRAVAAELQITIKAVENHVTSIFRKLRLNDRSDVIHPRVTAALIFIDGTHHTDA